MVSDDPEFVYAVAEFVYAVAECVYAVVECAAGVASLEHLRPGAGCEEPLCVCVRVCLVCVCASE